MCACLVLYLRTLNPAIRATRVITIQAFNDIVEFVGSYGALTTEPHYPSVSWAVQLMILRRRLKHSLFSMTLIKCLARFTLVVFYDRLESARSVLSEHIRPAVY